MQPEIKWRDDAAAAEDAGFTALLLEGATHLQAGDVPRARTSLEQALRVRPQNEKARNLLGQTYFRMGMFEAAIRVFDRLAGEYPDEPTLRLNLALVHLKRGDFAAARIHLEQVCRLQPDHDKALSYLGLVYDKLGELALARWAFKRGGSDKLVQHTEERMRARGVAIDDTLVPPWLPIPREPDERTGEDAVDAPADGSGSAGEATDVPSAATVAMEEPPVTSPSLEGSYGEGSSSSEPRSDTVAMDTPPRPDPPSQPTDPLRAPEPAERTGDTLAEAALGRPRPAEITEPQSDAISALQPAPSVTPAPFVRRPIQHPPRVPPRQDPPVRSAPPPDDALFAAVAVVGAAVQAAATVFEVPVLRPDPTLLMPAVVPTDAGPGEATGGFAISGPMAARPEASMEVTQDLPEPTPSASLPPLPARAPEPASFSAALPRLLSAVEAEASGEHPVPPSPTTPPSGPWAGPTSTSDSMVVNLTSDAMSGDEWLQRKSLPPVVRPFSLVGPGLLGLAVDGPVIIRALAMAAAQGEVDTQPIYRKVDDADVLLGSDDDPLVECRGNGSVTLDPGVAKVNVLKVEGNEVVVLESALFGASTGVVRQDLLLALARQGPPTRALRFTGKGVVAVRSATSVRAVPCEPGVPLRVSLDHLLAWEGALACNPAPGVTGLPNLPIPAAAVLTGKGVVLLKAGTR